MGANVNCESNGQIFPEFQNCEKNIFKSGEVAKKLKTKQSKKRFRHRFKMLYKLRSRECTFKWNVSRTNLQIKIYISDNRFIFNL